MVINCCSLCYSTYDDDENDDDKCFQSVNKIVVASKDGPVPQMDTYNDEDNAEEEEDTKYVLNEMKRSEEQLRVRKGNFLSVIKSHIHNWTKFILN